MKNITTSLVANLYNPHEQSQQQLIESFVARQDLFQNLYQAIKAFDPDQPGQHFLIEGQRGTGKTTLLLRLSYAIEQDAELRRWLIPLVFKEEAYYGIRRLFHLWENVMRELEDKEKNFAGLFEQLSTAYDERIAYEQFCYARLIDALKQQAKQIIVFIDNFGEFIQNFSFEERYRLYEILRQEPSIRIVGASAVALEAFLQEEDGLYTLLDRWKLESLTKEETYNLLLKLAEAYQKEAIIERTIQEQPGRVESLRLLTGGVIRTIVLLFEIFSEQEESNTLADLDAVLDRVTPLYKSRMDDLTPLQREVVHTIALNWEAMPIEEIARKARLTTSEVAHVVTELEQVFLIAKVDSASPPGRGEEWVTSAASQPLYRLTERFFNIWYLMRLSTGGSQIRVKWLLHFLENWYNKTELREHARLHVQSLARGRYQPRAAYYLTEAFAQTGQLDQDTEHQMLQTTKKLLQETDIHLAQGLSASDKDIFQQGEACYQQERYEQAITHFLKLKSKHEHIYFRIGYAFEQLGLHQEAVTYFSQAAEQGHVEAMVRLGLLYHYHLQDDHSAETFYLKAVEKGHTDAMLHLGHLYYYRFHNDDKAQVYYTMVVKEGQIRSKVLTSGSFSFKSLKNYLITALKGEVSNPELYQFQDFPQAKQNYLQTIEKTTAEALFQLGNLSAKDQQLNQKAESYYHKAADAGHVNAMLMLGDWYNYMVRNYTQAEKYYVLAAEHGNINAMISLGLLYHETLNNEKKAEQYYTQAADKGDVSVMNDLAWLYFEQKRDKQRSLQYIQRVVAAEKNIYTAHTAACIYLWNNRPIEAIELAEIFMYDEKAYETLENDIILYLMLLLAKQHYKPVITYFEAPQLDLKRRFTPLLYALLYFIEDPNYQKLPPELAEPVHDIIRQVKQLAADYV
ncbi:ATPase [Candidatus Vecturithrix granuli]|uniref:ATPase n=1 Tax=Vecturithrix granuli TaxID=1499967 RepID=A0A0S6W8S1_VECG1|nr:ATPase [Candidatus Vecturithrix granuli]